jgi:glycosyltransferase involved in cell wall biosynthesis
VTLVVDVRHIDLSDVSVVMPAMNEARNLPHVFARMPSGLGEVILVDGRSDDDTVSVARRLRPDVRVVGQTRRGKGNALACGFAAATRDIIVMIDADGSTDPAEIPKFVGAIQDGADFAKGSRFAAGGGSVDITRFRQLGNAGLNRLVNVIYGTKFTDLCYGYNAFRRHCLSTIDLVPGLESIQRHHGDGFEVETLINIRIAKAAHHMVEVPSFEQSRLHGVSNLRAFSDGMHVLRTIAIERRTRRARETTEPTIIDVTGAPTHAAVSDVDRDVRAC